MSAALIGLVVLGSPARLHVRRDLFNQRLLAGRRMLRQRLGTGRT
jgi:hypothetical protein